MKKILVIAFISFLSIGLITGCGKKEEKEKIETVKNIEFGQKVYINQLEKVKINNTDDYVIITEKVTWPKEKGDGDTTVSSSIAVPYTINVDGVDYKGTYILGGYSDSANDGNPKYNFSIANVKDTYETQVLISRKY